MNIRQLVLTRPQAFMFMDDGAVPNNAELPVLIYPAALDLTNGVAPATEIVHLFTANGWGRDLWRDGIYPFVHYHAMIHEVLGIAQGFARVQLGGQRGRSFELKAGDVVVLPAGTGHQRLIASADFVVIGGYPPDGSYNLCRGDNPAERTRALATIPKVPLPQSDPVQGKGGALVNLWQR
jgi:uncharacterized protein YjlB